MVAMDVWGPRSYLADSWNWLDLFIVLAGALEYGLPNIINLNFSPVRTIRVLRPLRAINRIPSKYIFDHFSIPHFFRVIFYYNI